ncbi:hypothetical protein Y697_06025 [Mesotoga sp. BH458_6_3_2_1]|nr:hypothetical protein Y697_06025 [Mesotoga sp. BH458_6_3_2_1]
MDVRLAKITPGRKARFAGKDLQTLPSGTDSIIYILLTYTSTVEQCRLRREVMPIKDIRRNAGKDRAGTQCTEEHQWTQGWRRSRQVARPASRGKIFKPSLRGQTPLFTFC